MVMIMNCYAAIESNKRREGWRQGNVKENVEKSRTNL